MRWVMARVFPVPAPASTHNGPLSVLATSRCSASSPPRIRSSREAAPSKCSVVTSAALFLDYRVLESGGWNNLVAGPVLYPAAVPVLNEGAGNGEPAGNGDLTTEHRFLEFLATDPAGPGDLHAVGRCLGVLGDGGKSKHKGGRERP